MGSVVTEWTRLSLPRAREQARALTRRHELTAVLDTLWEGGQEQRELAVSLAEATVHLELLERALATGDPGLCHRVLTCSALPRLNPELVAATLVRVPDPTRRAAFRQIRTRKAWQLADAGLAAVLVHHGENEAVHLLAACSEPVVEALLPRVMRAIPAGGAEGAEAREIAAYNGDRQVVGCPPRLGDRHPVLVLAEAERQLSGLPEKWWLRWWAVAMLETAAQHEPLRMLDLLERFPVAIGLCWPTASLRALVAADAAGCVRLSVRPTGIGMSCFNLAEAIFREKTVLRLLARTDPAGLVELARRYPGQWRFAREELVVVLPMMPPAQGVVLLRLLTAEYRNNVLAEVALVAPELSAHLARLLTASASSKPGATPHNSTGGRRSWAPLRRLTFRTRRDGR